MHRVFAPQVREQVPWHPGFVQAGVLQVGGEQRRHQNATRIEPP